MRTNGKPIGASSNPMSSRTESGAIVSVLRRQWSRYGRALLLIAIVYMGIAAAGRLVYALPILVSDVVPWGAIDLINRYEEVHRWFAGLPLYGAVSNADYPPASYAMLWPLLGWLSLTPARWLWAATSVIAAGVLAYLFVRESEAESLQQRLFAALLIFSTYPTQMNILVGQLGLQVLALVVTGLVWLHTRSGRWWEDLAASMLLLPALVKPTLSVPFFWIVLVLPGRVRPLLFVLVGYAALTFLAATFQHDSVEILLWEWLGQTGSQVTVLEGHTNIHKWLAMAGLEVWMLPGSLVMLIAHGAWTYRNRRNDFWVLMGVAALVSRLWVHHRLYDDVLMLIPMIPLFRLARRRGGVNGNEVLAGILLAAFWATLHIPTWAFYDLSGTITALLEAGQTTVWLSALVFLVVQASRDRGVSGQREEKSGGYAA